MTDLCLGGGQVGLLYRAGYLVGSLGWGPKDAAQKGQIIAASEQAGKDAVYLPANRILKYLAKSGHAPK